MTGYEIIRRNVKFENPDRIGMRFTHLGEGDVYRIYPQMPKYLRDGSEKIDMQVKWKVNDGVDEWGVEWHKGHSGGYPIKDLEESLDAFTVPNPRAEGRFEGIEEVLSRPEAQDKWIQLNSPYCLFERLHEIRGFENTLMDLYTEKEKMAALLDRLLEYQIGMVEEAVKYGKGRIHCFDTTDDWGTQQNLLIGPDVWRELFKPRYKKLIDVIHANDMVIRFHTDGNIESIMEDFIEIGVDIINIHQPRLFDIKSFGEKFAGRICFEVAVDIQDTLPSGDKVKIEEEVVDLVKYWATKEGGLIGCEYRYLDAIGAKEEDLVFAFECFKKYGNLSDK